MNNSRFGGSLAKTAIMLALLLAFVTVYQLARIGLINNGERYVNETFEDYATVENLKVSQDTHGIGKVALIYDSSATDRKYIAENIESMLKKYSVDYDFIDADTNVDLTKYIFVIPIIGNYGNCRILQDVFNYIEDYGGTAYFPIVPVDSDSFISVSGSLGIIDKSSPAECRSIIDRKGILGAVDTEYTFNTPLQIRYIILRLRSDCDIYFEDPEGNPLLWKRPLGAGEVYMSNCDYLSSYSSRGVFSQILFEMMSEIKSTEMNISQPSMIYPLYMTSTQVLQEFPSANKISDSTLLDEENVNYEKFIQNYFWPLFAEMDRKYGAKTTASFVLSYDVNTDSDFRDSVLSNSSIKTYATEILKNGGEIAFHGYSYRPLGLKGELYDLGWFIPWSSMESVRESIDAAQSFLHNLFANYELKVYIPPQGRVSSNVLANFRSIISSVDIIVSPYERLYYDQVNKDFEVGDDGYFYYSMTTDINGVEWNTINSLISLGISSFSVNVNQMLLDDVLTWDEFDALIRNSYKLIDDFPGLTEMTVSEACNHISQCLNIDYSYTETEKSVTLHINNWFEGCAFALRTEAEISDGKNYTAEKYLDDMYIITPAAADVTIDK